MNLDYTKISATDVIEEMRQDYLIMDEGIEKEELLSHIVAVHAKLNKMFYRELRV